MCTKLQIVEGRLWGEQICKGVIEQGTSGFKGSGRDFPVTRVTEKTLDRKERSLGGIHSLACETKISTHLLLWHLRDETTSSPLLAPAVDNNSYTTPPHKNIMWFPKQSSWCFQYQVIPSETRVAPGTQFHRCLSPLPLPNNQLLSNGI